MAATAPPNALTRGPAPTTVTVTGTVPAKDLAISFLATDSYVTNYPTSMFTLSAAAAGGAPPTASVPMEQAIRTWGEPLTFRDPDARNHAPIGDALTSALTGAAFSRVLTEFAASGLLGAGPFESLQDSDAALRALTALNPANLAILPDDLLALEPLDRAAIAAIAATPSNRGSGRSRILGAAAAVQAQTAAPGPPNPAFTSPGRAPLLPYTPVGHKRCDYTTLFRSMCVVTPFG